MNEELLILVGSRIRDIRRSKLLSQEKLGELAGLSYSYIGRMENGHKNISLKNLAKIGDALSVSVHEFFSYVAEYEGISEKDKLQKDIMLLIAQQGEKELITAKNILNGLFKST